jgi:5,8-dihydroxy-2-naphthoate synthase
VTFPIAISPCPNDTFLFHAWIHGLVGAEIPPSPIYADIQHLNRLALQSRFPLMKVSFALLPRLLDTYIALPVGAALGEGYGPLLIAREEAALEDVAQMRVAIPGRDTTAHHLLGQVAPEPREKHFCLYHEAFPLLERGEVDAAVVIHEQRFTYGNAGFHRIADLGQLWSGPVPLGCIVAKRSLGEPRLRLLTEILRSSLAHARENPEASRSFVLEQSQDKDPAVVDQHIALYVNDETFQLSQRGEAAAQKLLGLEQEWLFASS